MKVCCPHCHRTVEVKGNGRPTLNIGVKKVCGALHDCGSVSAAAEKLDCSRGLLYKRLKDSGMTAAEVLNGKVPA